MRDCAYGWACKVGLVGSAPEKEIGSLIVIPQSRWESHELDMGCPYRRTIQSLFHLPPLLSDRGQSRQSIRGEPPL